MGNKDKKSFEVSTSTQPLTGSLEDIASASPAPTNLAAELLSLADTLKKMPQGPESLTQRISRYVTESGATEHNIEDIVLYMGLVGETGEILDLCKKCLAHGKPYSSDALAKEVGDLCWYAAAIQRKHGRKNVSIEPFPTISNIHESAVSLARYSAATTPEFMTHGHAIAVTEQLGRITSMAVNLLGEMEIRFNGREGYTHALFESDFHGVLDMNDAKLAARYPSGKFTEQDANAKADEK